MSTHYFDDYPGTDLRDYRFPLRQDVMVKLILPANLTLREVARLTAFLSTLVDVNATQYPDGPSRTDAVGEA